MSNLGYIIFDGCKYLYPMRQTQKIETSIIDSKQFIYKGKEFYIFSSLIVYLSRYRKECRAFEKQVPEIPIMKSLNIYSASTLRKQIMIFRGDKVYKMKAKTVCILYCTLKCELLRN